MRGGRATQWQGESPAAAGKTSSVTAAPCQLPQRGSRGRYAPFLPPAFMRGEGHAVAGGVPRRSGNGPLSHASRASSPKGRAKGAAPRSPAIPSRRALLLCNLADFAVGEFSGPVRLRERHFFVQFVENDEKYFFIPHFPIAFCAIWLYNEQKYCREGLYGRTHSHCFR